MLQTEISLVVGSSTAAAGLAYADEKNIPAIAFDNTRFKSNAIFIEHVLGELKSRKVELIALAGYLKKIPPEVISAFPDRIINVHPALLPSFGGKGMYGRHVHAAVIAYGCKLSGATVHLVSEEFDTGAPILQKSVPVLYDDTPETLAGRILKVEHELLPAAIGFFADGRITISGRKITIQGDESF